jgi:hypothetical protein
MTFPGNIFHQDAVARTERSLFAIANGHFEVAFQTNQKLRLRWMDGLASPTSRQPDKLETVGPITVRHEQQRRRRPIISFGEIEGNLLEMAFSSFVGLQSNVPHGARSFISIRRPRS